MAVDPGLCRRRRIGPDEAGIAVRQVEDEEMGLLLDPADDDGGFPEISLGPKSACACPGGCANGTNISRPRRSRSRT